jgi:hypothetical protein
MSEFDRLLLDTIDEVLTSALGEKSVKIIYDYLEEHVCPLLEIPSNLDVFSKELRALLFKSGFKMMFSTGITEIGMVSILERAIAKILCQELGVEFKEVGPIEFASYITKLRDIHAHQRKIINHLSPRGTEGNE